jgi:branched-chain amino acid transport system permease protein
MVILGGRGNNFGALLGTSIFTLLNRATSILNFMFPGSLIDPNYIRWMITGALIVIVLIYKPKGILPEKPIKTEAWRIFEARRKGIGLKLIRAKIVGIALIIVRHIKMAIYWLIGREII